MSTTVTADAEVDVPVRVAYDQWTQFESFPHFMSGVESVRQIDDTTTHWIVSIAGVTRAVLLDLAPQLGYELEEGTFTLTDLAAADEAFTSSSVREVLPVSEVDGTPLPLGDAAPALQAALREIASR